jgi:hypothetical protein
LLPSSSDIGGAGWPSGTELHRMYSSNPGAENMKINWIGSAPVFLRLTQVFKGKKTIPPA